MKKYIKYLYIIIPIIILMAGLFYYVHSKAGKSIVSEDQASTASYEIFLNKSYQFGDFHIDFKEHEAADIKFEGDFKLENNPNYRNDWKSIFADVNNGEQDFAGHFKLFSVAN